MSFPRVDLNAWYREQHEKEQRITDEVRNSIAVNAQLDIDVAHPFDLTATRIFLLEQDGTLDVDAKLHIDDYADLIRWRALGIQKHALAHMLVSFAVGVVVATIIALLAR